MCHLEIHPCWEGGAEEMLIFPCVLYTCVDVLTGAASGQKTPTGMETTCRMCTWRCWILACKQVGNYRQMPGSRLSGVVVPSPWV